MFWTGLPNMPDEVQTQLQQIRDLQMKLNSTNDHAEMCALEDVMGRMLWLCLSGTHWEIILTIAKDDKNDSLLSRLCGLVLHLIREFIERGLTVLVNDDDEAHMWQIITDAEKGMLKWELLHSAWARANCIPDLEDW
ncbi:hypothetical protein EDC04DRAFT_2603610 [Pisolithus marmoratus]|nr:hypothetical protein EDC04DRAFT_2603610 [Pisolithus marmoratus]